MESLREKSGSVNEAKSRELFYELKKDFVGLDTSYPLANGKNKNRVYLDSAAATLMWRPTYEFGNRFLQHYSNTHSNIHYAARISTDIVEWSRKQILSLLGANPEEYLCFFTGSGSTSGFNRLARLFATDESRPQVLVSGMEHHSNDLPHRQYAQVNYIPVTVAGGLDTAAFGDLLKTHHSKIRYVTFCAISNVTGVVNPLENLAEISHRYRVPVIVDGAQAVAHKKLNLSQLRSPIDALVFSGHKLYTPGSPGVVVIKRSLMEKLNHAVEYGGGMVEDVYYDDFDPVADPVARQEAGTLNIPGIAMLGATAGLLQRISMEQVEAHEHSLQAYAFERFLSIPGVTLYGDTDLQKLPRLGAFAFNIRGISHSLTAAILNDFFAIAVRNHCFCAHPYVRELLRPDFLQMPLDGDGQALEEMALEHRGMVRVSFGIYSTKSHIDQIVEAVEEICSDPEKFVSGYQKVNGGYQLINSCTEVLFDPDKTLRELTAKAI